MYWGYSPAIDLIEEYKKHHKLPSELNILIYGGADARHILKTLSKLYRHNDICKVRIYVQEACLEQIARQLLFLAVAFDTNDCYGAASKVRNFMEIYGNTLLRPSVAKYLTKKSEYLINVVTDDTSQKREDEMNILNLERLKYRERDYLENLFKFWAGNEVKFDISRLWDDRVRKHLGERYDTRSGAFDWDLNMSLHQVGANQITIQEYKKWRNIGVGFTWTYSEPTVPNRSLVAGYIATHHAHHGYVGDIIIGPFMSYGIDSDHKPLLQKINHQNKFRATDVTEHNLRQIFHELLTGEEYIFDVGDNSVITEPLKQKNYQNYDDVIHIMSCSKLPDRGKFHVVWLSNFLLDRASSDASNALLPDKSVMILEGVRFDPANRKEEFDKFNEKMERIASKIENSHLEAFDASKDSFATIVVSEQKNPVIKNATVKDVFDLF